MRAFLGNSRHSFANQGTITLGSGAALHLGGSFGQGNIGALTNSGGTLFVDGTLNNTGSVLSTGTASGLGTVALTGTIVGGTVTGSGMLFSSGTLSGVTYVGALDLSASSARVVVNNGITLLPTSGTGPGAVLVTGFYSYLDFSGTQSLANAAVTLGGTSGRGSLRELGSGATLTLAPSVTIAQGGRARLYAFPGDTIVNQGAITAGLTSGYFGIAGSFTNQGVIGVSNGDLLRADAMITGNGTIALASNGFVILAGAVGSGQCSPSATPAPAN